MNPKKFWMTSMLAALAFGGLAAVGFPYGALGIDAGAERERVWLLTMWTSGVMAICFGASGLVATLSPIGVRDIAESGSVLAAIDARREARRRGEVHPFYNFAGWTLTTGLFLVLVYFVGWILIGS